MGSDLDAISEIKRAPEEYEQPAGEICYQIPERDGEACGQKTQESA